MSSNITNAEAPSFTSRLVQLIDWATSQLQIQMPNLRRESSSGSEDSGESITCNEETEELETSTWDSSSTLSATSTTSDESQASIGSCETLATPVSEAGGWGTDSMSAGNEASIAPAEDVTWDNSFFEPDTSEPAVPTSLTFREITLTASTHPTLFSMLTTYAPLSLSPASKHALVNALKRLLEHACFAFVDLHAPFELELLSLDTYDAIDINAWIALLHHLRSQDDEIQLRSGKDGRDLDAAFAGKLPNINVGSDKEICHATDTIGRLRHAAVHRWDYDRFLIHHAVTFLATLWDEKRIAEFEALAQAAVAGELKPDKRCTTKNEFLCCLVTILEEAFYRFAKVHLPDLQLEYAHAVELHDLAEKVICRENGLGLTLEEREEVAYVCRLLRNVAAHYNSFSKEAIQTRECSSTIHCMYDKEEEPYKAMARDVEKVAQMIGDDGAARKIRLALWAADVGSRDTWRIGDDEEEEGAEYFDDEGTNHLANAHLAAKYRPRPTSAMVDFEADRTVYQRYGEAIGYHERCASDLSNLFPEVQHVFEIWSSFTVGEILDPRPESLDDLDWTP